MNNSFGARGVFRVGSREYALYRLAALPAERLSRLPITLKILLENLLRNEDGVAVRREDIEAFLSYDPQATPDREIAFHPARVLLQDFSGVPAVLDLAAMREAVIRMGGDPARVNPLAPMDLVIDHSVQVDHFGSSRALSLNGQLEFQRNQERYAFLRWGQEAFPGFRVVPPGAGICHQVNLEYLARGVFRVPAGDGPELVYPDTLVGTDSHTTMINGLGVFGWGVGGIEAEAAMLGQPVSMLIPPVVGVRVTGRLREGTTATDVVLAVTQALRKKGVVGKFVEFFGPGLAELALPDRATIANMAPEYGATMGFFPVDEETLAYLRLSNRPPELVELVRAYCLEQGLFRREDAPEPLFQEVLGLELGEVESAVAGPKRPQDRLVLKDVKRAQRQAVKEQLKRGDGSEVVRVEQPPLGFSLGHGAVVIAAITSCTNTSNPSVMLGAGLVAKKAVERGLTARPWVKTSLAPGSRVVSRYLRDAGLMPYLEALGFHEAGFGCMTCIGNSGPLAPGVGEAVAGAELIVAGVLSGNRNFEGRIHPLVRMNFLASPMLVVAYALAGDVDRDLAAEPIAHDREGQPVYLRDLWPTREEILEATQRAVRPEQYAREYGTIFDGDARWQGIAVPQGQTYAWVPGSTYVRRPPFFDDVPRDPPPLAEVRGARCLALLGDSITTDHISPAGGIAKQSPAAEYLIARGVKPEDFNQYGARRGDHEVMARGTFAHTRLKNLMVPGTEGGVTVHLPSEARTSIYEAATRYAQAGVPAIVVAGAEYGTGSARDWAAKGTRLLGVRAVLAKSFERIHRSNLVGMGVLPCQFMEGEDAEVLGLTGRETFEIEGIAEGLSPGKTLTVTAAGPGGARRFAVRCRIDTANEVEYYRHGGILLYVIRQLLAS